MTKEEKLQVLLILDGVRSQMENIREAMARVEMGEEDGLRSMTAQTKYSLVQMDCGMDGIKRLLDRER
jgi:hypothetical protein